MAVRTKKARPGMKLKLGASVLVAARAVDTHTVKESLRRFEEAHRSYVEAQSKVDAAQSALDAGRERVSTLHAAQGDAVDTLMRVLIWSGYPRKNPFAPLRRTVAEHDRTPRDHRRR
jgi:CO dehydrogenase/acetyl-CoA synthase gamma subunit (corrinoid Fe-S protein)